MHGYSYIGNTISQAGIIEFCAVDPAHGSTLESVFHEATDTEVDRACELAAKAFPIYRTKPIPERALFLERIAEEIMNLGDVLIQRAHAETGLPIERLIGERSRTCGQLKLFAALLHEGSWIDARIDTAQPDRQPVARQDLRSMLLPLGTVAVFGASNFPFAYSAAGGDTASSLAAGCTVIVKGHPLHPGTSELTSAAILSAAHMCDMPEGVFSMLQGKDRVGTRLVTHPLIDGVGFTGSLRAGRAIFDAAADRERPIPVYAEMGSINPIFILPKALSERHDEIAKNFIQSVTLGNGQFCTNPGILIGLNSHDLDKFIRTAGELIKECPAGIMLADTIHKQYEAGSERLASTAGVSVSAFGVALEDEALRGRPALFSTTASEFLKNRELHKEVFGPSSLIIRAESRSQIIEVAEALEGQLTATIHGSPDELDEYRSLISILETKAGRLIWNGFPTGVEVCNAVVHGGPYPATTDSRTTSVGTAAILRFVRPVCYQNCPNNLLPIELANENSRNILRMVNGEWTRQSIE